MTRIRQKFENKEQLWYLDKQNKLKPNGENDLQEVMNSRKRDSLTELYEKYMSGEIPTRELPTDAMYYDMSLTQGKDKLEMEMERQAIFQRLDQVQNGTMDDKEFMEFVHAYAEKHKPKDKDTTDEEVEENV